MSCRKDDIEKYRHDISILKEALELASSVSDRQKLISEDLTSLQSGYGDTVKASDDLISEFHKLDSGAQTNADSLKTTISEALDDAEMLLKAAEDEERYCPVHSTYNLKS